MTKVQNVKDITHTFNLYRMCTYLLESLLKLNTLTTTIRITAGAA